MSEFVPLGEQIEIDEVLAEPTSERVISLLNEAQLYDKEGKLNCLHQVQELIIHKDPSLLDNFMDEVIAFQQDASAEVRKCVISFMEEACKKDPGSLSKVVPILQYTMSDNNVNILKRVLTCVNQLYRLILEFLLTRKSVTDEMVGMWESMKDIKNQVLDLVESSDNCEDTSHKVSGDVDITADKEGLRTAIG
ncbi:symplekin-like isoform X2 [Dysidea avara]|uniref:symplekin-like isoform X2 n=1 Tax=Dysidea avara TaxID=196820 RepID=UPI003332764B